MNAELHPTLLKYVLSKISREAKRTLNVRDAALLTWGEVRQKLETHYAVQRTFTYYCTQLCQVKQKPNESVTQWGTKVEQLTADAVESTCKFTRTWNDDEREGGRKIIARLGRTVFINGICSDAIREAVKINSDNISMKEAIDRAVVEESDRKSNVNVNNKYSKPNFVKNATPQVKKESVNLVVTCYGCGKEGHIVKNCRATLKCTKCHRNGHVAKDCRVRGSNPTTTVGAVSED